MEKIKDLDAFILEKYHPIPNLGTITKHLTLKNVKENKKSKFRQFIEKLWNSIKQLFSEKKEKG